MALTVKQAQLLVSWFDNHKRDLPWRDTGNPYDVWISEIMLQQTRVEFVKERFVQFRSELPNIAMLAACDDEKLMKLWEGMGYYSRARNLRKCAIELTEHYDGKLPADVRLLESLPGIGPYTAGAIASIAFGIPAPAVDGNVLRVIARVKEDDRDIRGNEIRKAIQSELSEVLSLPEIKDNPSFISRFNQGLMELGALICVPNGAPLCDKCPWENICRARQNDSTDRIPWRRPLKARRIEPRTILVIRDGERFLLQKRPARGLLAGLYEFIGMEGHASRAEALEYVRKLGFTPRHIKPLPSSKHIFSHIEWHMNAYEVMIDNIEANGEENALFLTKKELQQFAVPSAFHAYKAYYDLNDQ